MEDEELTFEQYGLLRGLSGPAREQRLELLEQLRDDGFSLRELREAADQGRLALLRVQRRLMGEAEYSVEEVAERAGLELETLERLHRSLGMVGGAEGGPTMTEEDIAAAKRAAKLLEVGLREESVFAIARVIAVSMSQFAAAVRQAIAESIVSEDDTELALARRFDGLTKSLAPEVAPLFDHAFRLHLRQQLDHVAIDLGEDRGNGEGGDELAVGFADLVEFTRLGDQVPPEELGWVTGRLDALARDAASGEVRLVKMIGDAAMFSSGEPAALAGALLDLLEAADREDERFPVLRAGMARGVLVERAGDVFGRAVNLADRLTGIAHPGSLLADEDSAEALEEGFRLSDAGRKRLKGFDDRIRAYRVRRAEEEEE